MKVLSELREIICRIGGADLKILEKCPSEDNKFIAVGIGILNTVLLSMITMFFAIHSIGNGISYVLIAPISILWGFIIFGIDWGLVTTIHKKQKANVVEKIMAFFGFVFRVAVAVVISFTVSKPLEVLVFKDYLPTARHLMKVEYNEKLDAPNEKKIQEYNEKTSDNINQIEKLEIEKQEALKNDIVLQGLKENWDRLQKESEEFESARAQAQRNINRLTEENKNYKDNFPNWEAYKNKINDNDIEVSRQTIIRNEARSSRDDRRNRLEIAKVDYKKRDSTITADYKNRIGKYEGQNQLLGEYREHISEKQIVDRRENESISIVFDRDNLITNIIAIGSLEKYKSDSTASPLERKIAENVFFVRLLLMILIMIVDMAPIVIKSLTKRGPYEVEKENIEKTRNAESLAASEKREAECRAESDKRKTECHAESEAYKSVCSKMTLMNEMYKAAIKEQVVLGKTTIVFYKNINTVTKEAFNEIRKIIKEQANYSSQETKVDFNEINTKLEKALIASKKKMLDMYNDFIAETKS
ncbi:MAG: DUF4407 domain-containing protein [Chitinispirillales bacterium]|jgi:hypothetical protein|nr:DUF4407 domain-containing protein [Chitinispirillales bacterium]